MGNKQSKLNFAKEYYPPDVLLIALIHDLKLKVPEEIIELCRLYCNSTFIDEWTVSKGAFRMSGTPINGNSHTQLLGPTFNIDKFTLQLILDQSNWARDSHNLGSFKLCLHVVDPSLDPENVVTLGVKLRCTTIEYEQNYMVFIKSSPDNKLKLLCTLEMTAAEFYRYDQMTFESEIEVLNYGEMVYRPIFINSQCDCEWNIDQNEFLKKMIDAPNGRGFHSPIMNGCFCVVIYPHGKDKGGNRKGSVKLGIEVVRFPSKLSQMNVHLWIFTNFGYDPEHRKRKCKFLHKANINDRSRIFSGKIILSKKLKRLDVVQIKYMVLIDSS